MGTEYYLTNRETKQFYNLGKGGWYVLEQDKIYLTDQECLAQFIHDDVFTVENDPGWMDYCKEISKELFDFCNGSKLSNIVICPDNTDDSVVFRSLGYRCVGSRYRSNGQDIEFENRHFDENVKSRYDRDKLIFGLEDLFTFYETVD